MNERHAWYVTDRQRDKYHKKANFRLRIVILTIRVEMADDNFWSWCNLNRSAFHKDMLEKRFYIFVPGDLDLSPLRPQVCLWPGNVVTKFEISMTFRFQANRRHGRMDSKLQKIDLMTSDIMTRRPVREVIARVTFNPIFCSLDLFIIEIMVDTGRQRRTDRRRANCKDASIRGRVRWEK